MHKVWVKKCKNKDEFKFITLIILALFSTICVKEINICQLER